MTFHKNYFSIVENNQNKDPAMRSKKRPFSHFSRIIHTESPTFRPDKENQLQTILLEHPNKHMLARGHGLSYSDSCVHDQSIVIDMSRFNHLLSFDDQSGIAVCQSSVTFSDLLLIHRDFIPPVLPGTLQATLGGGIAHDIHGKNNPHQGNLGDHIAWLDLQVGASSLRCSKEEHPDLFFATIAGLGLTGIIKRVAIRLKKASRTVTTHTQQFTQWGPLLDSMQQEGVTADYQAAWINLLSPEMQALLSFATHIQDNAHHLPIQPRFSMPPVPIRLITAAGMRCFNRAYFHFKSTAPKTEALWAYNNPLDALPHWQYLYGKQGVLQFQAVFNAAIALQTIQTLIALIRTHQATPTLAVLKYFTKAGLGLLSFTEPGFTFAIDFIHNRKSRLAIAAMNQYIATLPGKIYLAKDLLLTPKQFRTMYPNYESFHTVVSRYHSPMQSDLSKRLDL